MIFLTTFYDTPRSQAAGREWMFHHDVPLIWWTAQGHCERIGEVLPANAPEELAKLYESRYGRAGRGRLWIEKSYADLPNGVVWPQNYVGDEAESCAGIVVPAEHYPFVAALPGFVTHHNMEPLPPIYMDATGFGYMVRGIDIVRHGIHPPHDENIHVLLESDESGLQLALPERDLHATYNWGPSRQEQKHFRLVGLNGKPASVQFVSYRELLGNSKHAAAATIQHNAFVTLEEGHRLVIPERTQEEANATT